MATLNIRKIDPDTATRVKRAAGARGWTVAQYIEALTELHQQLLAGGRVATALKDLGLEAAE